MTTPPQPHPHALRDIEGGVACGAIQKILVVVDPTARSHPSVEKAARIAASFGSAIELYVCDVAQEIPESWAGGGKAEEYREMLRLRRLQELERLATPLRASGLHVSTLSEWRAPLEEGIARHVIQSKPDLVVKDTHRHVLLPRVPMTLTDWILIRHVPAPLLLVRPQPWRDRPRILASVDPSRPADRPVTLDEAMLAKSCAIGGALAASVEVLHVLRGVPHLPGENVPAEATERLHGEQRTLVEQLVARTCGRQLPVHFLTGPVAQGVLGFAAAHDPDIVVLGAVAHFHWGTSGPSGTASQLLEYLNCDVLVVKPPGFVSPLLVTDS